MSWTISGGIIIAEVRNETSMINMFFLYILATCLYCSVSNILVDVDTCNPFAVGCEAACECNNHDGLGRFATAKRT